MSHFSCSLSQGVKMIYTSEKKKWKLVTQSCLTLCDPMNCRQPGSFVHGILQARILEWVAIPFSRRSSQPRDWTWVSCIASRFFTHWATREALSLRYKCCHWPRNYLFFHTFQSRYETHSSVHLPGGLMYWVLIAAFQVAKIPYFTYS